MIRYTDFVAQISPTDTPSGFPFGASQQSMAAGFRKLADKIENGDVTPQLITFDSAVAPEDFAIHTLTLRYAEKVEK